ncbi:MAG: hypothetical protein O7C98_00355 [Planctomycetota bacterium]|nr:hypothetical protein [Planctomycetota bacterium]
MPAEQFPVLTPALVREIEALKAEYYAARVQGQIEAGTDDVAVARFRHATAFRWPSAQRVYGLGALDLDSLDEIEAWLDPDRPAWFYVLPLPEDEPLRDALTERGYVLRRSQSVLYGIPFLDRTAPDGMRVRWAGPEDMPLFARTFVEAYGWEAEEREDIEGSLLAQYSGSRWRCCLAEVESKPVAIGVLYVGDRVAFLTNAATKEDYRGRGCQSALQRLRVTRAALEGCALIASDTTPYSQSQRNLERAGLRLAYQQVVWERPPA